MAPTFDAPWTDLQVEEDLRKNERFQFELRSKNIELNRELGVLLLQMHIGREDLEKMRAEKRELEARLEVAVRDLHDSSSLLEEKKRELQELRMELALLRSEREEQQEQEQLAVEIWGPASRRQPDATWDPPAVLLFSQGKREKDLPLTVGRVAADIGVKCSAQSLHRLGSHVRDAFMRAHGRAPEPRVFYNGNGVADKIGCFTERDRELIAAVLRAHGEPGVD